MTQAFVATEDELAKIEALMRFSDGKSTLTAKCADGIERSFTSLSELFSYENAPKKAIHSLRIRSRSADYKDSCTLRLDDSESRNVYLSIDADEERVVQISERLDERLNSMKPWYHRIAKSSTFFWIWLLYVTFWIVAPLIHGKKVFPEKWDMPATTWVISALIGFSMFAFVMLIDRMKRTWFPMGVFSIGQGSKRHHDYETVRTVVIVGFVISLVAGIVTTWLG